MLSEFAVKSLACFSLRRAAGKGAGLPGVEVAIGVILDGDGNILICHRGKGGALGGLWEFPGGKFEAGETAEGCLRRELREELDVEVELIEALDGIEHDYADLRVRLHPFICRLRNGHPRPLACQQLKWVKAQSLRGYPFPQANADLIVGLMRRFATGQI